MTSTVQGPVTNRASIRSTEGVLSVVVGSLLEKLAEAYLLLAIRPCALKSPVEFHLFVRFPGEALWLLEVELLRDLLHCTAYVRGGQQIGRVRAR